MSKSQVFLWAVTLALLPLMAYVSHQGEAEYAARQAKVRQDLGPEHAYMLTGATNLKHGSYITGGKYPTTVEFWEGFDTKTHYVVNPRQLDRLCPDAFPYNLQVVATQEAPAPSVMDKYVEYMSTDTRKLMARPLQFDAVSPALAKCPWLSWDKETKSVSFHGKPVLLFSRIPTE